MNATIRRAGWGFCARHEPPYPELALSRSIAYMSRPYPMAARRGVNHVASVFETDNASRFGWEAQPQGGWKPVTWEALLKFRRAGKGRNRVYVWWFPVAPVVAAAIEADAEAGAKRWKNAYAIKQTAWQMAVSRTMLGRGIGRILGFPCGLPIVSEDQRVNCSEGSARTATGQITDLRQPDQIPFYQERRRLDTRTREAPTFDSGSPNQMMRWVENFGGTFADILDV